MDSQDISSKNSQEIHAKIISAYQAKDFTGCLELIEDSLKSEPSNNHHKILKASCWTFLNMNGPETISLLEEVIAEDPKNSFAYYGIGQKYYNDGELMKSVEYLNKAIELNPTNAMQKASELKYKAKTVIEAICDANVKFEAKNYEKAMRSLSTALYADPENVKIQEKIAQMKQFFIAELVGRLEKEVKEELTETCKELEVEEKVLKAEDLIKQGKNEKADKIITEISEIDPKHKEFKYLEALSLYMLGNLKESIKILDEVMKSNADHQKAKELREKASKIDKLVDLAAEKLKQKKHEESIEILTEVTSIDKQNVKITSAAYFQRSVAHYNLGNSTNAYNDFKIFEAMQGNGEMKANA